MQPKSVFWKRRQVLAGLGSLGAWALSQSSPFAQNAPQSTVDLGSLSWADILERARGSSVNWAMWSGSEAINGFVDGWVKSQLQERYGIRLNRIPLTDTVEAVNKVIGEVQAGLLSGGSIDLIWINGNNFRTLKQGICSSALLLRNCPACPSTIPPILQRILACPPRAILHPTPATTF
jgi:Tat (twin-arginine translocation) pathway signal sequence